MKRIILFTAALTCVATTKAQEVTDTLKQQHLEEVIVAGVRVQKNAPYAVANIKKSELEAFSKTGRELPFLLAQTPGVSVTSCAFVVATHVNAAVNRIILFISF